jgi:hypothetical protein
VLSGISKIENGQLQWEQKHHIGYFDPERRTREERQRASYYRYGSSNVNPIIDYIEPTGDALWLRLESGAEFALNGEFFEDRFVEDEYGEDR